MRRAYDVDEVGRGEDVGRVELGLDGLQQADGHRAVAGQHPLFTQFADSVMMGDAAAVGYDLVPRRYLNPLFFEMPHPPGHLDLVVHFQSIFQSTRIESEVEVDAGAGIVGLGDPGNEWN